MTKPREPISIADFTDSVTYVTSVLAPAADRDWSVKAGILRWSCLRTAGHLGDTLLAYACQIVTDYQSGWVPFRTRVPNGAEPCGAIAFVGAAAVLFAEATAAVDLSKVAYHPFGNADVEGFLAMGCAEILVHGYDIAQGLALQLHPDRDACARVITRLLPTEESIDEDPWSLLLAATNRIPHVSRRTWRYHSSPLL